MYPLGGYTGRLLRVDLTNHTARSEPLDTRLAELYLGGRGLGARLLYNEVGPQVAPLDPENKLFFLTGPLVGTLAPTSARLRDDQVTTDGLVSVQHLLRSPGA